MSDIRKILEKLSVLEGQNAQQKSVPQLPADFNAGDISPVLGAQEKAHPTHNYFVGEEDASHNGLSPDTKQILEGFGDSPVAQAIANRIMRQFPEMITDYGIEHLMHAIEQQAEMVGDVEEIGSSDVGAWIRNIKRDLDGRLTQDIREETVTDITHGDHPRAKNVPVNQLVNIEQATGPLKGREAYVRFSGPVAHGPSENDTFVHGIIFDREQESSGKRLIYWLKDDNNRNMTATSRDIFVVKQGLAEGVATEDVLSTVKKKLGDYLKNIEDEIKSDPDLKDKLDKDIDVVGPAVKTITTDDGHEIKIHGNEDDGFRITIQNKPAKSTFKDLDEASMAVEMFNARRRRAAMPAPEPEIEIAVEPQVKVAPRAALLQRLKQNNDYVDEK